MRWKQTVCTLALLLTGVATAHAATTENYKPKVAAHRGSSGYLPEHTLPAKAMAHAFGADYIEQDVVITKDGIPVVVHDIYLDTVSNVADLFPQRKRADGRYYANDFTLAEIKTLALAERFHNDTGKPYFEGRFPKSFALDYRVPTLEEEFLQVQGLNKSRKMDTSVYVEVKEPAFFEKEGLDALKITIDTMTKYGYNTPESKAILQIFDYEAVKRARELGWKGPLAMLVTANGQGKKDDKARHAWLTTDAGLKDVAQYATIFAPNFNLMAVANADGSGYTVTDLAARARKAGMQVHGWTHRVDALPKGFTSSDEMLDVAFKQLELDGLFSDFPDVVVRYLERNNMR